MTKFSLLIVLLVYFHLTESEYISKDGYLKQREKYLMYEMKSKTGGQVNLTTEEKRVNHLLLKLKDNIYNTSRVTDNFPPAMHFFNAKKLIENSQLLKILKAMPKGAVLHVHDLAMVDINWIIQQATYDPNCYMCVDENDQLHFRFFATPPHTNACRWKSVNEARQEHSSQAKFDEMLYHNMTLLVDNPETAYPTVNVVWKSFLKCFGAIAGAVLYRPVFLKHYYESLNEFYKDNVQYVEIRALIGEVYELDGTTHSQDWVLSKYQDITQQFVKDHPDFSGAKIIYSMIRDVKPSIVGAGIQKALEWRKKYPNFFAGFDLVGQEDPGNPLLYYLDQLLYPSQQGLNLPYFFHAGETDWYGIATDQNIMDALLLNTSRIGHGYAITKHPKAMQYARDKDIAIEVSPLSNQVLKLVDDLRNHPAATLMSTDFPMVISSDDPVLWGARGLSYDFYMAFVGIGGKWADLATLKQLAINSIRYSAMSSSEKKTAMQLWQKKWNQFIRDIVAEYNL